VGRVSRVNDMVLYHKDIGFPSDVNIPTKGKFTLNYGNHARVESYRDRYGTIDLPPTISLEDCDIIEIGVSENRLLSKLLVRRPHTPDFDICIVFHPDNGFVRTVWLNSVTDTHSTLDATKYAEPDNLITIKHWSK
jgi:hypothetical protein